MPDDPCLVLISIAQSVIQRCHEGDSLSKGQVLYIILGVRALPCSGRSVVLLSRRYWGGDATVGITKISTSLRA